LLELVVEDNSLDDELERWVVATADPRLSYARSSERRDVVANFDAALSRARGRYVAFVGDDDCATSALVDVAQWALKEDLEAVVPSCRAYYLWPGTMYQLDGPRFAGTLTVPAFTGVVRSVDPLRELDRCLRSGGTSFGLMPRAYHGLVLRERLEDIRARAGTSFPGPSPDMSSAVALSLGVRRACAVDFPLFVDGASPPSTGGMGAAKRHEGALEDKEFLPVASVSGWSTVVPRFWSGTTIWAEDVVQALRAFSRQDLLQSFNVGRLHARCLVFNRSYSTVTVQNFMPAVASCNRSPLNDLAECAAGFFGAWIERADSLVRRYGRRIGLGGGRVWAGIRDVEQATSTFLRSDAYVRALNDRHPCALWGLGGKST
jgi:hypothetical protein